MANTPVRSISPRRPSRDPIDHARRRLAPLALCVLVALTAACAKDDPVARDDAPPPPSSIPGLPTGGALTPVEVTRSATPSSVDPQLLPDNARKASAMSGLTAEQKMCIDDTIYRTIQGDPSIASDDGKLASVMGSAMALCNGDRYAATLVESLVTGFGLTADQAACVQQKLSADPGATARLLGAVATADLIQVSDAFAPFESSCGFTLAEG
jgi:hypothetical protein